MFVSLMKFIYIESVLIDLPKKMQILNTSPISLKSEYLNFDIENNSYFENISNSHF